MILSKKKTKSIDLDFILNEKIKNRKLNEVLIIVPTNRKVRSLRKELVAESPGKVTANINVHTLSTLSLSLFKSSYLSEFFLLDDATAVVLLNKTFNRLKPKYFSGYKDEIPRGTLERIKNVISEYKRNGISPELLLEQSETLSGAEKSKAEDIAYIYKEYLSECRKNNLFETGDVYGFLNELSIGEFAHTYNEIFGDVNLVLVNGFDEFSSPEIELLNKISDMCSDFYIQFDYYKYNPSLFSHLDECFLKLKKKGFDEVEDLSEDRDKKFYSLIRAGLFSPKKNEPVNVSQKIFTANPKTTEKEIQFIAKEIKRLIVEENVPPEKICVAFNLISDHSKIIRDVFTEYGIPFNLTDRFLLSESPIIIALINLLEIIENNFYYKNIFRTLSGKWIDLGGVDLSNILKVASNLKIVAGYNNWIESIDNVIEEMKISNEDDERNFLDETSYLKAKEDIRQIAEILEPFTVKLSIKDFRTNLNNLIVKLGIIPKALNDHSDYTEKNIRALTSFVQTINNLFELLEIEFGSDSKFGLSFYLKNIKASFQFARYNIREKTDSGVLVTSINEIRGLRFDYLFIGGMTDGEFPTKYQPEIFMSGSFRKEEYKHLLENRYHFYQALCTVENTLYLSSPLSDEKKEFTVSTFIKDLSSIVITENLNADEYDYMIASKRELLKSFGENELNNSMELKRILEASGIDTAKVKKNLQIDRQRIEFPFGENIYTGFLTGSLSNSASEKLKQISDKVFSATELEEYAKCPFRYFLNRILSVETIEEPTEEIEAFEIGSLIHSILYSFYKTISESNRIIENCSEEEFAEYVRLIFSIAEKKTEHIKFSSPYSFFEREKIFGINGDKKQSILYKFLEEERKEKSGFTPMFFELAFGFRDTNPDSVKLNEIKLRGKIDRIDFSEEKNSFKVIDYKLSGRKPSKEDINLGIALQLSLYLYASQKLLEAEFGREVNPAGAEIYSLKIFNDEFGRKLVHNLDKRNLSEEDIINASEELIKIFEEKVPVYVEKIRKGIFHLSMLEKREDKICGYCEFRSICRIEEVG